VRVEAALAAQGHALDASQRAALSRLEDLRRRILARKSLLARSLDLLPRARTPLRGLYLWGGVGRGKTFLVDAFFSELPIREKRREHFHRFMQDVHARLRRHRDRASPLEQVAAGIAAEARVLAIDEFVVGDVADALRVPYVEIEVGGKRTAAGRRPFWLPASDGLLDVTLTDGAEPIGRLRVAPRAQGASFSRTDRRLIDDLARRVSAAAREVSLRSDLQRSRERLVLAREEERRALRRALHDEFGPVVAGLSLRTEAARRLVDSDPAAAATALGSVRSVADELVTDIRRLAYDLRPPALDELGLAEALRLHGRSLDGVVIAVHDDGLGDLPAAVEAAAYRIAAEAMINVSRHAAATYCEVELFAGDGTLTVTVVDDGRGLPEGFRAGVGVTAMRERAEELGGACRVERGPGRGTVVRAVLPTGGKAA
jgi:signal transduction histidine kinase